MLKYCFSLFILLALFSCQKTDLRPCGTSNVCQNYGFLADNYTCLCPEETHISLGTAPVYCEGNGQAVVGFCIPKGIGSFLITDANCALCDDFFGTGDSVVIHFRDDGQGYGVECYTKENGFIDDGFLTYILKDDWNVNEKADTLYLRKFNFHEAQWCDPELACFMYTITTIYIEPNFESAHMKIDYIIKEDLSTEGHPPLLYDSCLITMQPLF